MGLFSNLVKLFLALRKDEPKLLEVISEGQQIVGSVHSVIDDIRGKQEVKPEEESK